MTEYSNPRLQATVHDWPSGKQRVTADFRIEFDARRGQRAVRTTTGKPKALTYARKVRIVDGDDGRIYILQLAPYSGHISIMKGTFDFQHEVIHENDSRHAELLKMFEDLS